MKSNSAPTPQPASGLQPEATNPAPFGVNEERLNWRQWLCVLAVVLVCANLLPWIWTHVEKFNVPPDYRVPYALSSDYWLYQRRLNGIPNTGVIPVLGDSVVWGEYVKPNGTLTHFLNSQSNGPPRFVNCGLNGVFPLAMEGLVKYYGGALHNRKVIVQCNMLWMSSPKADLSIANEETFNHSQLVPQFVRRVPCYRADTATRLGIVAVNNLSFMAWVNHLNVAYFDSLSIPLWTLEDDGNDPPAYPNAWKNPLARITLRVPSEPANDPQRGPQSPRHKPWNAGGAAPTHFEWVPLSESLQWRGFQRTIELLKSRGCDVLVVLGPFNEWMVAREQRVQYAAMRAQIAAWLASKHIATVVPTLLPSNLYADASHPLTAGYALLAKELWGDGAFRGWASLKAER